MDILYKLFLGIFTIFTYFVAFHDGIKIIINSWKYGRLRKIKLLPIKMAVYFLPDYYKDEVKEFTNFDVIIQISKLQGGNKVDQKNALKHLEYILDYFPRDSDNLSYSENKNKIKKAIYLLLLNAKTDSEIAKHATHMLCENDNLRPECGCSD